MSAPPLKDMLAEMIEHGASDLYLAVDAPPSMLVDGQLRAIGESFLMAEDTAAIARTLMSETQWQEFEKGLQRDLAVENEGERFRLNVYYQRNTVALVARLLRQKVPSFEELGLPPLMRDLSMLERGLILITGATGTGKSTTLASMIDWRNRNGTGHIVTIEDPIEFSHQSRGCVMSQREVGVDTHSFHDAIRAALRQAPRVILIGETRDSDTATFLLRAAETGHLVFSTLHTSNAAQTLDRLLGLFPPAAREEALAQLAQNLRAIVSQRLVPRKGGGRVAVLEILLNTSRAQELIQRGDVQSLKEVMTKGAREGMRTFDMSLYDYVQEGVIEEADALRYADSANDLKLRFRGLGGSSFA